MLGAADVDLVVLEATGGYERGAVCALQDAGIAVARQPRQARDFASPWACWPKTDGVDARTLRDFCRCAGAARGRQHYITPMLDAARQEAGGADGSASPAWTCAWPSTTGSSTPGRCAQRARSPA